MYQSNLSELFSTPANPSLLSHGSYDARLVLLSLLVAIFASWMGLQMAGQARGGRALRAITLLTGSLALGSGVWAMHFVGMLAFDLCTRVDYDPTITIASLVPSVAASFVALSLIGRAHLQRWHLAGGGLLVGAGIGSMHYMGMAAMKMNLLLRYDPWMFALSIVVAVVLATLALWVRFGLREMGPRLSQQRLLLASAVVMGCAIAGMHYTGMAAARFVGQVPSGAPGSSNSAFLAMSIALITVAFTVFVAAANGMLRYRELFLHLRQSEGWLRALLTTTVDGVITVDGDGSIREFNASAERIFGWTRDEVLGRSVSVLMADVERSRQDGLLAYLRDGGLDVVGSGSEVLGLRKDGSVVPIRRAVGHARMGARDLFVCFITDISERRAMVQALRDSEQQFRSLIGNIPGVSYRRLMVGEHQMVYISDAVERVTGYPAADFLGTPILRSFRSMIHPGDRARVARVVEQAILNEKTYLIEYRLQHADGSTRWLWENGTAVRNEAGEVQWLDGVILDISARHQMEEALRLAKEKAEQAAAARATFVANMSHEIRTPMNSILGFTDVLLDGELTPEQRRHLDTVRNAGRSLLRLLNEVLDTAKLDKGAVELELSDFSLLALIDELSSTLGANARAKGLTIDIGYDQDLPTCLRGDELRIRQVLTNLLDNAIKFTAAGTVKLVCDEHDGQLHFLVQDTGIGIAPERLSAIFEPFTQADASMTRRFGGTGLGTTISRQLVDLMGGRIWAESASGAGTAFHVLLPLVPAEFAPQQRRNRAAVALPPLHVLAADDVPQNLELLNLLLTRRGHTMVGASDGAQAFDLAERECFDIILMDVQMARTDGLAATRAIRASASRDGRARVPIVAMTASVLDAHRRACAEAGMDGFSSKPVDWFALSHEMARVLGLSTEGTPEPVPGADAAQVLNREAGLRRWTGRVDAYRQALFHFAQEHGSAAAFANHARTRDYAQLQAQLHRVRGVAANLGLEQLSATLLAGEELCEQAGGPPRDAALPELIERLTGDLAAAVAAIGPRPEPPPAPVSERTASGALDQPRIDAAALALAHAFARGALDDAALNDLADAVEGHIPAAQIGAIHAAISDFDFALAQRRIDTALASLASKPEGKDEP
ncbi:MAG: MHYT domain-containing protein [Pseudomonadota bacterium]